MCTLAESFMFGTATVAVLRGGDVDSMVFRRARAPPVALQKNIVLTPTTKRDALCPCGMTLVQVRAPSYDGDALPMLCIQKNDSVLTLRRKLMRACKMSWGPSLVEAITR